MTDEARDVLEAKFKSPPWTDDEVAALNAFQQAGRLHPFTCGSGNRCDTTHSKAKERLGLSDWGTLIATADGWICPACDYTQDWAHDFMFEPLPPDPLAALIARAQSAKGE